MGDSAGVRLGWRLLTRSLMDMSFGWGEGGGGRAGQAVPAGVFPPGPTDQKLSRFCGVCGLGDGLTIRN